MKRKSCPHTHTNTTMSVRDSAFFFCLIRAWIAQHRSAVTGEAVLNIYWLLRHCRCFDVSQRNMLLECPVAGDARPERSRGGMDIIQFQSVRSTLQLLGNPSNPAQTFEPHSRETRTHSRVVSVFQLWRHVRACQTASERDGVI